MSPGRWPTLTSASSKLLPFDMRLTGSYGDSVFYRLRPPFVSRGEGDSQDWQADVADLTRWLRSVNGTSGFKVGSVHTTSCFDW